MRIVENIEQMIMDDTQSARTHLFMVRVWLEDLGDGNTEWRGQVKHVLSGEVQYFRDWAALADHLQAMSHSPVPTAGEASEGA